MPIPLLRADRVLPSTVIPQTLDADTVDGKHAADLAPATHTHQTVTTGIGSLSIHSGFKAGTAPSVRMSCTTLCLTFTAKPDNTVSTAGQWLVADSDATLTGLLPVPQVAGTWASLGTDGANGAVLWDKATGRFWMKGAGISNSITYQFTVTVVI